MRKQRIAGEDGKHYLVTECNGITRVFVNVSRKGVRWSSGAVQPGMAERILMAYARREERK